MSLNKQQVQYYRNKWVHNWEMSWEEHKAKAPLMWVYFVEPIYKTRSKR